MQGPSAIPSAGGRLLRAFTGVASVWLCVALVQLLHVAWILERVPHWAVLLPGLLLALALETAATVHFAGLPLRRRSLRRLGRWARTGLGLRLLCIVLAFGFWVVWVGALSRTTTFRWITFVGPRVDVNIRLVLWGMGQLSLVAGALWLAAIIGVVGWWGRLRWTVGLGLPAVLGFLLFQHLYELGGQGRIDQAALLAQPGVSVVWRSTQVQGHPRDICAAPDRDELLISFGCTVCPVDVPVPGVIRVDLATGEQTTFISGPVREFDCKADSDSIAIAPWLDERVFLLDRSTLEATTELTPSWQPELPLWEPMAVIHDRSLDRVFVANDVHQALVALSAKDGSWLGTVDLWEEGRVSMYGTPVYSMAQAAPGSPVYFTSGPGQNVFALDPASLELLATASLGDMAGTALTLAPDPTDPAGGSVWVQSSVNDDLHELAMSDLSVRRKLRGERFSRGLAVDRAADRLYLLTYFTGRLEGWSLSQGQRLWSVAVGGRPNALHVVDGVAWVNSMAGVVTIDLARAEAAAAP